MRNLLVVISLSHLIAGCVATSHELESVKSQASYDRQEMRAIQEQAEQRLARVETKLQRLDKNRSTTFEHAKIEKRVAAVEAELRRIEKKSALAVQMGLISSVHADSNDQGIASIRADVDRLTAEIKALEMRLIESDRQLEAGLIQLKDISGRLK